MKPFNFEYFLKDYWRNVRMSLAQAFGPHG